VPQEPDFLSVTQTVLFPALLVKTANTGNPVTQATDHARTSFSFALAHATSVTHDAPPQEQTLMSCPSSTAKKHSPLSPMPTQPLLTDSPPEDVITVALPPATLHSPP
jgi:hypothetical protein